MKRSPRAGSVASKAPFSWRKYGKYTATGLFFMYLFKGLGSLAEATPMVQRLERANLDALFHGRIQEPSKDVFIVDVTEEDYNQLFGGISPLNPSKLIEIIQAVIESGPKTLGVDFDTSAWKDLPKPSAPGIGIAWARDVSGQPSGQACYGVPAYYPNDDGFIRQYTEYIKGGDQAFPSLPVDLADLFLKGPEACRQPIPIKQWKAPDRLPLINYAGDKSAFDRLSAGALLQLKGPADDATAAQRWAAWAKDNPLKGKLVLLGGAYRAARDAYPTPVGYLDGVDILAHTAQTRLPGHELRSEIQTGLLSGWFSFQGYLILLASYFIPKPWRLGITILTGPLYAFAGSWFWFFSGGTFLSFMPYLVGLVMHQIYNHFKDFRKIKKENQALKEKLRELGAPVPEPAADP